MTLSEVEIHEKSVKIYVSKLSVRNPFDPFHPCSISHFFFLIMGTKPDCALVFGAEIGIFLQKIGGYRSSYQKI